MDRPEDQGGKKPEDEKSAEQKSAESKKAESKLSDLTDKLPDISEITNKFDLDKILGGIKSMIGAEEEAVHADPNDALGQKIEALNDVFNELSKTHAKLAKDFAKANELLLGVFKDLEAVRQQHKN